MTPPGAHASIGLLIFINMEIQFSGKISKTDGTEIFFSKKWHVKNANTFNDRDEKKQLYLFIFVDDINERPHEGFSPNEAFFSHGRSKKKSYKT